MEIKVHTRRVDIPDQLRESAVEKARHLERFMDGTQFAEVIFSRDHAAHDDGYVTCEILVVARGRSVPRSCGESSGERCPGGGDEQGGGAAHSYAGPSRAPLAAPPWNGRATDGTGRLNLDQSSGAEGLVPGPSRVVIVGATGTGKTALALDMARAEPDHYELVSVDAIAVYRHLDLGTAKPTRAEQLVAPWHLIDIVDPSQQFSVAAFQAEARSSLAASRPTTTFRSSSGEQGCITGRS